MSVQDSGPGVPASMRFAVDQLDAFPYDGFTASMDTFKDKQHFDELYAKGKAPWEVWLRETSLSNGRPLLKGEEPASVSAPVRYPGGEGLFDPAGAKVVV